MLFEDMKTRSIKVSSFDNRYHLHEINKSGRYLKFNIRPKGTSCFK